MQILSFGEKQYQLALENEEIPQKPYIFCEAMEILFELFEYPNEELLLPFMKYCISCIKNHTKSQLANKSIIEQKSNICNDFGFIDIYYLLLYEILYLHSDDYVDRLIDDEHLLEVILDEIKILNVSEINQTHSRFSSIFHEIHNEDESFEVSTADSDSSFFCYRLKLLSYIFEAESNNLTLNVKQCSILFEAFLVGNENIFQIEKAFEFFIAIHRSSFHAVFQSGCTLHLFQNYILPRYRFSKNKIDDENALRNIKNMSESELKCFCYFMMIANSEMNFVELWKDSENSFIQFSSSKIKSISSVLKYHQLLGMQELWSIMFDINIMVDNAVNFYFQFISNLQLVSENDLNDAIAIRKQLLNKCTMELEKYLFIARTTSIINSPTLEKISRILRIIGQLLFHARLTYRLVIDRPLHIQLQNCSIVEVKLNGRLNSNVFQNERFVVKHTMLFSEIQQSIADRCQTPAIMHLHSISFKIGKSEKELYTMSLKTIGEMDIYDDLSSPNVIFNLTSKKSTIINRMPLVDEEKQLIPSCVRVLSLIYESYSPSNDDNSMTMEDFRRYIFGNGFGPQNATDIRLRKIFQQNGTHEDPVAMNALSFDGFLNFYEQARIHHVWNDLYVHGFRKELRTAEERKIFEKPLFTHENCLLFVMVENEKYWNIIWDCFQLNDNKINTEAYDILLHLPTKNEIRELFESGIESVVDFEELIFGENEKLNNYWMAYCLFLCEWLFTNNMKWREMFLDKNGIQCMVKLLEILSPQIEECRIIIVDKKHDQKEMKEIEESSDNDNDNDQNSLKGYSYNKVANDCVFSILRLLVSVMELEEQKFVKYQEILKPIWKYYLLD